MQSKIVRVLHLNLGSLLGQWCNILCRQTRSLTQFLDTGLLLLPGISKLKRTCEILIPPLHIIFKSGSLRHITLPVHFQIFSDTRKRG